MSREASETNFHFEYLSCVSLELRLLQAWINRVEREEEKSHFDLRQWFILLDRERKKELKCCRKFHKSWLFSRWDQDRDREHIQVFSVQRRWVAEEPKFIIYLNSLDDTKNLRFFSYIQASPYDCVCQPTWSSEPADNNRRTRMSHEERKKKFVTFTCQPVTLDNYLIFSQIVKQPSEHQIFTVVELHILFIFSSCCDEKWKNTFLENSFISLSRRIVPLQKTCMLRKTRPICSLSQLINFQPSIRMREFVANVSWNV